MELRSRSPDRPRGPGRALALRLHRGTISAALLTLVVLPVSYYWVHAARAKVAGARKMPT